MSEHLRIAEYHREEARKAFDKQGELHLNPMGYAHLQSVQFDHERAAAAAESAHAEATGQRVDYTPLGKPVFSPAFSRR